ncbi:MAG: OmpA family protein [Micropepsaceae bacterium]
MEDVRDRRSLIAYIAAAALVLLAIIGIWTTAPAIETDLETRAAAALAAAGISGVTPEADGRTITLYGPARPAAERDAALAAAAVFGVRHVTDAFGAAVPGAVTPGYRFAAAWTGATLTLTGAMPSLDARESLIAFARDVFPGRKIVDDLAVAPNPPSENWPEAAMGGLKAMQPLSNAILTIEGHSVSLAGNAPSEEARARASDLLAGLPEPFTMLADIEVNAVAAPVAITTYTLAAAFDGSRLALSGQLPSEAARAAIRAALNRTGLTLDDKTQLNAAAPDGAFTDAAIVALTALTRSVSGTMTLEGRSLTLDAIAKDAATRAAIAKSLADLPAAYAWTAAIGVSGAGPATAETSPAESPARACQTEISEALAATPVVFASASAELPDSAEPLVAKIAAIAATCPEARLEIAGHTDASGNAQKNITLSENRAGAVEAALIVRGVDAARLSAKGYGAARPIASNDNDADKARNRRIEVIVRP